MSFLIEYEKLLEKYKAIWTKIEDLKDIDDRFIKIKIRTCNNKFYTNFRGFNVPEDDILDDIYKMIDDIIIYIDSLLVYYKKYYLQVYLDNCAYKVVNKQMPDYLHENLFED